MATTTLTPAASRYSARCTQWLTTTDHKKIGIMYIINSFIFFFIGGLLALGVRTELAQPGLQFVTASDLQRAVHDARDVHDLPVRHPDAGGLRQLRGAAPDRRAGHGLPADQRPLALDAAARRHPAAARLHHRRHGGGRLDELRAIVRRPAAGRGRGRPGPVDRRARADRHQLDPGRHQLPGHDLQDAGAGHDPVPDADHGLDGPGDVRPRADGDAGHHQRPDHAVHRPQLRRRVLRPGTRRRRDPLPERLLVLLAPGGLRDDPARDGHGQRDPAGLLRASRCSATRRSSSRRPPSARSASPCGPTTCSRPARSTCRSSAS